MSQQKFIDRNEEMDILKNHYYNDNPGLIVIYGRRRVGKTELINHFMSCNGLYFLATNEGDTENIRNFQRSLSEFLNDKSIEYGRYNDWYSLFASVVNNKKNQKLLLPLMNSHI
jgi:AAA+ ATPase superfamily predicted ATPase